MPFENLSGDPAQDYLPRGMTEDVIVELGRFRDFNVLSRQSTSAWGAKAVDVREVGKALGADYVLEGSARKVGDRLRVTGRLISARTAHRSGPRHSTKCCRRKISSMSSCI